MPWDSSKNRLTRLLERKRRAGVPVLDLTESNPTRAGIPYPRGDPVGADGSGGAGLGSRTRGLPAARRAVAAHGVPPESVLLTASTSEAYALLFKMLCDPGDAVLVPQPSYPLFDHLAALEGVRVEPYPLRLGAGWAADLSNAPRDAKAVIAVNPNNPTGSFLRPADLDQVAALGMPLISDEVFAPYALAGTTRRRANAATSTCSPSAACRSPPASPAETRLILATGPGAPAALDRLRSRRRGRVPQRLHYRHGCRPETPRPPRASRPDRRPPPRQPGRRTAVLGKRLLEPEGGWYAVEAPDSRTDGMGACAPRSGRRPRAARLLLQFSAEAFGREPADSRVDVRRGAFEAGGPAYGAVNTICSRPREGERDRRPASATPISPAPPPGRSPASRRSSRSFQGPVPLPTRRPPRRRTGRQAARRGTSRLASAARSSAWSGEFEKDGAKAGSRNGRRWKAARRTSGFFGPGFRSTPSARAPASRKARTSVPSRAARQRTRNPRTSGRRPARAEIGRAHV